MNDVFNKWIAAPLVALVLSSFVLVPIADARGGGRGGGGERSAASANAGGGGRQVDNSRQDARANDVRGSSVNNVNASSRSSNVNVNRNTNINVEGHGGGCCGGGWDNDHPVAAAAAVTATVVGIGNMVRTPPANANCVPVNHGGIVYQQCGSTWYQPQGGQYMVVAPPY